MYLAPFFYKKSIIQVRMYALEMRYGNLEFTRIQGPVCFKNEHILFLFLIRRILFVPS